MPLTAEHARSVIRSDLIKESHDGNLAAPDPLDQLPAMPDDRAIPLAQRILDREAARRSA